jgi:hypothetical protein
MVLGKGHRLFDGGVPRAQFTLAASTVTKAAIIVAAYELKR